MLVQRLWFALLIRPSANMLSQTLQKTSNFCSLVNTCGTAVVAITLSICAFEVIIQTMGIKYAKDHNPVEQLYNLLT